MKSIISSLFLVFSLLLVANLSCARKEIMQQGEYWRNTMKGQPMPEAIKDLIVVQDSQVSNADDAVKKGHFIRDFDVKTNVILYHTHAVGSKNNNNNDNKQKQKRG